MKLPGKGIWILIGVVVVGLLVAAVGGILSFRSYLRSAKVLADVGSRIAGEVKTPSGFLPFQWSGMNVFSEGLVIQSKPGGPMNRLEARGVTARCDFSSLWRKVVTINELDVEHLQVGSGDGAVKCMAEELSVQPELHEAGGNSQGGLKVHVVKTKITVCDLYLGKTDKSVDMLKNCTATLRTVNSGLEIEVDNGVLKEATFPELNVEHLSLRYVKPGITIREGKLKLDDGRLTIRGMYDTDNSNLKLAMAFDGFPIGPLLPEGWKDRLQAQFTGNADMLKDLSTKNMVQISGTIHFPQARLEHYPAQKKLATLTHREEFNRLVFTKLECEFIRDKNKIEVRKFEAEVKGLLVIEGRIKIEGGDIDATLNVGIDPSALEPIPGARNRVFTETRSGYAWTAVKLDGPVRHPHEDLSPRLLAAAKKEVIVSFFEFVPKSGINVIMILEHLF